MQKRTLLLTAAVLMVFGLVVSSVNADTFSKKRVNGVYEAWYDSSVSSYGYTGAFDKARENWRGISSKVSIGKTSNSSGYSTDEVYVGTTSVADRLGLAVPYVVSWPANIPVDPDVFNWDYSVISLYHNNIKDGDMVNSNNLTHITTHEFGHALGLSHTTGNNTYDSIMKSSTNKYENIFKPTNYDQGQLRSKWGN